MIDSINNPFRNIIMGIVCYLTINSALALNQASITISALAFPLAVPNLAVTNYLQGKGCVKVPITVKNHYSSIIKLPINTNTLTCSRLALGINNYSFPHQTYCTFILVINKTSITSPITYSIIGTNTNKACHSARINNAILAEDLTIHVFQVQNP